MLHQKESNTVEYKEELIPLISDVMNQLNMMMMGMSDKQAYSFIQRYTIKKGINKWGEKKVKSSAFKEVRQIKDRNVFEPIFPSDLTTEEKRKAMEYIIFMVERREMGPSRPDNVQMAVASVHM